MFVEDTRSGPTEAMSAKSGELDLIRPICYIGPGSQPAPSKP